MGTVYAQVDHRFCRRWAVLTDPEETLGASGAGVKVSLNNISPLPQRNLLTVLGVNPSSAPTSLNIIQWSRYFIAFSGINGSCFVHHRVILKWI